jgi:hypothetical protein
VTILNRIARVAAVGFWDRVTNFAVGWAMDRLLEAASPDSISSVSPAGTNAIASDASFKQAAVELRQAISDASTQVIEKLESDKLELLGSRIRILGDMIKIGDKSEILRYQFSLREVVDYAENRIAEGKSDWTGPLLLGKVAIFSALQICSADTEDARKELETLCRKARHEIADLAVRHAVREGNKIPWMEIDNFLACKTKTLSLNLNSDGSTAKINKVLDVVYTGPTISNSGVDFSMSPGQRVSKGELLFKVNEFLQAGFFRMGSGKTLSEVTSEVDGIIDEIFVTHSEPVTQGLVLARIKLI